MDDPKAPSMEQETVTLLGNTFHPVGVALSGTVQHVVTLELGPNTIAALKDILSTIFLRPAVRLKVTTTVVPPKQ